MMIDKTIWEYLCGDLNEDEIQYLEDGSVLIDGNRSYDRWKEYSRNDFSLYDLFGTDGIIIPDDPVNMMSWKEKGCILLSEGIVQRLSNTKIRMDPSKVKKNFSFARHPYYMIRGKSITPDQVQKMLLSEYPMLSDQREWDLYCKKDDRGHDMLNHDAFGRIFPSRSVFGGAHGWLRESGEIGINDMCSLKHPSFQEIMPLWFKFAVQFPFLDMVIGYTNYDESPCFCYCVLERAKTWAWISGFREANISELSKAKKGDSYQDTLERYKYYCGEIEALKNGKRSCPCKGSRIEECELHFEKCRTNTSNEKQNFYDENYCDFLNIDELADDVRMTVQIKNGNLTILTGEEAVKTYKEYVKKYTFEDPRRYSRRWNEFTQEPCVSETFLRDLMKSRGLDDDKCIEFLVKNDMQPELMKGDWKKPEWLETIR